MREKGDWRDLDRAALSRAYDNSGAVADSAAIVADWRRRSDGLRAAMAGVRALLRPAPAAADRSLSLRDPGRSLSRLHPRRLLAAERQGGLHLHGGGAAGARPGRGAVGYTLAPEASLTEIAAEICMGLRRLRAEAAPASAARRVRLVGGRASGRAHRRTRPMPRWRSADLRPRADRPHQPRRRPAPYGRGGRRALPDSAPRARRATGLGDLRGGRTARTAPPVDRLPCRPHRGRPRRQAPYGAGHEPLHGARRLDPAGRHHSPRSSPPGRSLRRHATCHSRVRRPTRAFGCHWRTKETPKQYLARTHQPERATRRRCIRRLSTAKPSRSFALVRCSFLAAHPELRDASLRARECGPRGQPPRPGLPVRSLYEDHGRAPRGASRLPDDPPGGAPRGAQARPALPVEPAPAPHPRHSNRLKLRPQARRGPVEEGAHLQGRRPASG